MHVGRVEVEVEEEEADLIGGPADDEHDDDNEHGPGHIPHRLKELDRLGWYDTVIDLQTARERAKLGDDDHMTCDHDDDWEEIFEGEKEYPDYHV